MGTDAGQVALVGTGKLFIQQARNRQAQDRVTKEFKPLVVLDAEAAMRQRARQQLGLVEAIAKTMLKGGELRSHIAEFSWSEEKYSFNANDPGT